jgi:fatty-acyl-CoA synthase
MIEEAYYRHEAVAQAVALGKPDKRVGEFPITVIQLKPGASATSEEMIAYGGMHIHERAAVPKEVHFVDAMPLTAVGKIFKPTLRNELIRQQMTEELSVFLDQPFTVEVSIDKKFGQCVTVTAPGEAGSAITEALGDYAFKLVVVTA